MYRFFIFCLILLNVNMVFAAPYNRIKYAPANQFNTYRHPQHYHNRPQISLEDLSALEKYATNRSYTRDNPLVRVERLENLVFGAVQYGDIVSRYNNVKSAILSKPSNYTTAKRSFWGDLTSYIVGQPTGVTPSINNYSNSYIPSDINGNNYGRQRYEQFSNGMFGSGYSLQNNNFGNGSSIRILD